MNVLFLVAHPDDAELSCGIKIQHHINRGDTVVVLCLSLWWKKWEQFRTIRKKEAEDAWEILGVHKYMFWDITDGSFLEERELVRERISSTIKIFQPERIYTHFPHDLHHDHVVTAEECLVAARHIPWLIYFKSPGTRNFRPNHIALGSPQQLQKKIDALRCFQSQTYINDFVEDLATYSSSILLEYLPHHLVYKWQQEGKDYFGELFCIERQVSAG